MTQSARWSLDARIPVVFGTTAQAGPEDALMDAAEPGGKPGATAPHPAGCACCVPRSEIAGTLAQMFLRRARGEMPFFRRVLVLAGADTAAADGVRAAVRSDPLLAARFRLG